MPTVRRLDRALRAAALACAAALVLAAPATARAAVPPDWAGVNAQGLFPSLPQSAWGAHADAMRDAGVRLVRLDAEWRRVEPVAPSGSVHGYSWGFYDAVVATLAARGIRWYPIVDYAAPWSGVELGAWRTPPRSAAAFAGYAAALARRYGPGGAFWAAHPELPALPVRQWEIWNEENGAYFWPPAPDPTAYADVYLAARAALHHVDPGARVVVGGLLSRGAGQFLSDMLAARPALRGAIDAVGLHAYGTTVDQSLSWMVDLRNWLVHLGLADVPIEVTEVGWTTSGVSWSVPDGTRAADIAELLPRAAALPGIDRLVLHTWTSREQWPSNSEDWYGIVRPDGSPTASSDAFARALSALAPPAATARGAGADVAPAPALDPPSPADPPSPGVPAATMRPAPRPAATAPKTSARKPRRKARKRSASGSRSGRRASPRPGPRRGSASSRAATRRHR